MMAASDPNIPAASVSPDAAASGASAHDRAIRRGVEYAARDLQEAGGAYGIDELRQVLHGASSPEIDQRVADGSILEVRGPNNQRRFPKLQFKDDEAVVEGLKSVFEAFPSRDPWALLNFLINPQDSLQGSKPIDLLRGGDT